LYQGVSGEEERIIQAYHLEAITTEQLKAENIRIFNERQSSTEELRTIEAKLSGAVAYQGKVNQVFELLNNFEPVWLGMQAVHQRVIYRGIFNNFFVESRKYSRHYEIKDFSLKEPFKSWYHNRTCEGSLVLDDGGNVLQDDNQKEDKELCQKICTFG